MVCHPRCGFINYVGLINCRTQDAPYSQLTAEILGNDHQHSRIPSPSVRRSQPEQARRSRHTDWIVIGLINCRTQLSGG